MSRRPSRFRLLLRLGLPILFGVTVALYARSSLPLRHLRPFVIAYISDRSGATARIGALDGTLFGRVIARDVALTQNADAPPILWADELEISFRVLPLLRRVLDVETVRASGLELHTRRNKGQPFDIQTVVDRLTGATDASAEPSAFTVRLRDVDLSTERLVVDDFESGVRLKLNGERFQSRSSELRDVDASRPFELSGGAGDVFFGESRQSLGRVALRGWLSPQRVVLNAMELRATDSTLSMRGSVALAPTMRLDLTGNAFVRLRDARALSPAALKDVDGDASLSGIRVIGDAANPALRATVVLRRFRHPALQLDTATADVVGNLQTLAVAPIRTRVFSGAVSASAILTLGDTSAIRLRATAERLDLQALRTAFFKGQSALEPLSGAIDGTVVASLVGSDIQSSGVWTARRLAWQGKPVATDTLRHTLEKGLIHAEGVIAGVALDATGRVPQADEPLNFRLSASTRNIADAASLVGLTATGAVTAEATVAGDMRNPVVEFGVRLSNGTVNGVLPLKSLDARGDWNPQRVHLSDARLVSGDGYARATGNARFAPNTQPQLDFRVQAERLDIAPYVQPFAKNLPVAGALSGALDVRGAPRALDLLGDVHPLDVRAGDVSVAFDAIPVRAVAGKFELPRIVAAVGDARASGRASFDNTGYAFEFGLDNPAPVASLRASLPESLSKPLADLSGALEFDAWGRDRFDSPSASLTVSLDDARFRNTPLGRNVMDVLLDESEVRGRGTLVDRRFDFDFAANLAASELPLTATIGCVETDILPLIRIAGQPAGKGLRSALLTGSAAVSGGLAQPDSLAAEVVLDTVRLSTARHVLENTQPVRGTVTASGVQLDRLTIASSDPEHPFDILAEGLLDWERPVEMTVDARALDLATIADFVGLPDRFRGSGTYRMSVRGTTREPVIETSWRMSDASFVVAPDRPPLAFRDVAGGATYRDKALRLERVSFRLGQEPIVVNGEVPLDLSFVLIPLVDRVVDAPLNVTIRSRDSDLSWLKALDSNVTELDGETELDIRLSGTVDKPVVEGAASLSVARVRIASLNAPLTDVLTVARLDTTVEPDGTRRLRARLEGGGFLNDAAATWDGYATIPIGDDYLSKGFRPEDARGEFSTQVANATLSTLVGATGAKPLPVEAALAGGATWSIRGVDPKSWRGALAFDRVTVSGNGRTLTNRAPVTATFAENVLTVGEFALEDGTSRLEARGSLRIPTLAFDVNARATDVDVALFGGFVAPRPLAGRLDATFAASGALDAPRFSTEWQVRDARIERVSVDTFRGGVHYDGNGLVLRDWEVRSYGNRLAVDGLVPLDIGFRKDAPLARSVDAPLKVAVRADGIRLDFMPLVAPAIAESAGTANVDATIGGTLAKPILRGSAAIDDGRFRLAGNGAEITEVAGSFTADGNAVRADNFQFKVGDAVYAARDAILTMDGLNPTGFRSGVEFSDATVESWLRSPGSIKTSATGTGVVAVDLAALRLDLAVDKPQTAPVDPVERALRFVPRVEGVLVVESAQATVGKYRLVTRDASVARLRGGVLEFGSMTSDVWRYLRETTGAAWSGAVASQTLAPLTIEHDASYDPAQQLSVRAKGAWDVERALEVNLTGSIGAALVNELIAERAPKPSGAPVPSLSGRFRFDGRMAGTARNPRLTLSASADSLQVNAVAVQDLSILLTFSDETFNIERGRFLVSGNEVRVGGEIPFAIEPLAGRFGVLDRDFEILVDSDLNNVDFLPAMFPAVVQRAEGSGTVHLTVGGRFQTPLFRGSVQARNLLVDAPANHILVSDASVDVTLEGDALRVERSRPMSGKLNGGTFQVSEAVVRLNKGLPTSADVRGTLDDVTFYEPGEYRLKTDATLRAFGSLDHLRVSGEVLPSEVRYEHDWERLVRENLSSEAQMQRRAQFNIPLLRGVELDVSIQADQDIVVDTGAGELEARFDGRVVGLITAPVFVGEVSLPKGEFSYLGNRFRIESGRLTNADAGRFDPEYTIVASTAEPLRGVRLVDELGRTQVRDARVHTTLRGRLEQAQPPEFAVSVLNRAQGEEYSLTTQQGISLLTFGDATLISQGTDAGLTSATENLFKESAQSYLGGRFARALGLRTLNVDVFADDIETSRFSLTKELSSQWVITYASTLQLDQEQRLEVEYLVNRNLSVIGERNEQGKYGVDLKFEYDFR